jgi:tetratricopeptide (TPR) repeat protein
MFFDGLLQKSTLDVFFVCFSLWLIGALVDNPDRPPAWLALGIDLGCLALTRENSLILAGAIVFWALVHPNLPWARRATVAAVFVVGLSGVLLPVALRNKIVGDEWHLTTSQAGANFYIGNNARASGVPSSLREGRGSPEYEQEDATDLAQVALRRRLTPAEVSQYWTAQAITFIRSQPGAWLRLMARKTALLVNRSEWIDTESQDSYEEWSTVLRAGAWVGHFGVLVPLALVGVIATWRARAKLWVLYLMAGAYAASVVMFYVSARYRFPLAPFLLLFAAAGVVSLPGLFRGRTPAHVTGIVAAVAALAILANWPMLWGDLMRAITENNLGTSLQEEQRLDEAAAHYRRALSIRSDYAPAYNNLGVVLLAQGRPAEAVAAYEHAHTLMPAYPDPEYNLGNALLRVGKTAEAIDHFKKALTLAPGSADVYNNLGIALASTDRLDEAIDAFETALRFDADSFQAHRNLGVVLIDRQRFPEAIGQLHAAIARMPGSWEAHNSLGIALGATGRFDEAIVEFEEALRLEPDSDEAQRNLDLARQAMQATARRSRTVAR